MKYRHTKRGLSKRIYANQKINCKKRGHISPRYSSKEFTEWFLKQDNLEKLYKKWVESGFDRWLTPSVDRKDDYLTYSFTNIRLVTWRENSNSNHYKGSLSNKRRSRSVIKKDLSGNILEKFDSINDAAKSLGNSKFSFNISNCVKGIIPSYKGFRWVKGNPKILILGDARHGKDTLVEMLSENCKLDFAGSSLMAAKLFLYDVLNLKHGLKYSSIQEAWEDRVNHRDIWYNEICAYNSEDKLRLVKDILKIADIYVGLRNYLEVEAAIKQDVFDFIIGIYDYRKPREDKSSNTADVFKYSDFVIMNNGTLEDLEDKVIKILLKVIL